MVLGLCEIKCKREQRYRRLTDALLGPVLSGESATGKKLVLPLTVRAEIFFPQEIVLRVRQTLDFAEGFIHSYSYEVYRGEEKLYWYDSWPHPRIPELAATDPHHKHVPPDLKHHRIPAPTLTFDHPNLPFLIQEIEQTLLPGTSTK